MIHSLEIHCDFHLALHFLSLNFALSLGMATFHVKGKSNLTILVNDFGVVQII